MAADLVVLYGPEMAATELWRTHGEPRLVSKAKMVELDYPDPRGEHYFALPVEPTEDEVWPELLPFEQMVRLQEDDQAVLSSGRKSLVILGRVIEETQDEVQPGPILSSVDRSHPRPA